jgi:release factor glutamine methyltransferase
VAAAAPIWLAPGGHLLLETSERQAPDTVEIVTGHGLAARVACSKDLEATVVIATKPARD